MRKKRLDIGFLFWIVSMVVILSLTIYRYVGALKENRALWREYNAIERRIESLKEGMEFIEREGR